jgi:hypothetical protein
MYATCNFIQPVLIVSLLYQRIVDVFSHVLFFIIGLSKLKIAISPLRES